IRSPVCLPHYLLPEEWKAHRHTVRPAQWALRCGAVVEHQHALCGCVRCHQTDLAAGGIEKLSQGHPAEPPRRTTIPTLIRLAGQPSEKAIRRKPAAPLVEGEHMTKELLIQQSLDEAIFPLGLDSGGHEGQSDSA